MLTHYYGKMLDTICLLLEFVHPELKNVHVVLDFPKTTDTELSKWRRATSGFILSFCGDWWSIIKFQDSCRFPIGVIIIK